MDIVYNVSITIDMEQPGRYYDRWMDENLDGNCYADYEGMLGKMTVYFDLEEDAMAFKLRWL